MKHSIFEAQRLLKLIEERDPECARLLVQAIEQFTFAGANAPIKYILQQIYTAIPNAALSEKEKELLCPSSDLPNKEQQISKLHTDQNLSA
jgi:hypothetical protein